MPSCASDFVRAAQTHFNVVPWKKLSRSLSYSSLSRSSQSLQLFSSLFSPGKKAAKQINNFSNLKQLHLAFRMICGDHDGTAGPSGFIGLSFDRANILWYGSVPNAVLRRRSMTVLNHLINGRPKRNGWICSGASDLPLNRNPVELVQFIPGLIARSLTIFVDDSLLPIALDT